MNIAVLVSGSGTNLQALIDAQNKNELSGRIACVISSKPGVYSLERARLAGIDSVVLPTRKSGEDVEAKLLEALGKYDIGLVVLAGFLSILGEQVISKYRNRIINVHPSLIPSFCGKGFYGLKVHESALQYGVKVSGATVHFVNEIPDGGAIILQKAVEVKQGDTPETLQRRIMEEAEWKLLPEAVRLFCEGKLRVVDNKTIITEEN
ncbi:MAG: phosphoribosylglycinamide formyltransferase [Oscillospiraceae bacterium]|nr:phosphoribosylglycinamide formyltransferase [Oscillospiraceae bacterium]